MTNNLSSMIWIEMRKALRSKVPLWTSLAALFTPLGVTFLIFVSKNPEISKKLGLISAKADLVAYAGADWQTYLSMSGMLIAAGGFILFVLITSWVFGREFVDGTLKDMLAVPVDRASILLAKFILVAMWAALQSVEILAASLVLGVLLRLPGGSTDVLLHSSLQMVSTAGLTILVVLPFALFASIGRGYLLPMGLAVLVLMLTNLVAIAGWGNYFPWAVPGLLAQGKTALDPVSFWIVVCTGLAGMLATYAWWQTANQNR